MHLFSFFWREFDIVDSAVFNQISADEKRYPETVLEDVAHKKWRWTHSIWSNDQRQLCLNPINIKTTACKQAKNASIKALITHFSHCLYCIRFNEKRVSIDFTNFFSLSFSISVVRRCMSESERCAGNPHHSIRKSGFVLHGQSLKWDTHPHKKPGNVLWHRNTDTFHQMKIAVRAKKIAWLKSVITLNVTYSNVRRYKWWRRRQWYDICDRKDREKTTLVESIIYVNRYLFNAVLHFSCTFNWVSLKNWGNFQHSFLSLNIACDGRLRAHEKCATLKVSQRNEETAENWCWLKSKWQMWISTFCERIKLSEATEWQTIS